MTDRTSPNQPVHVLLLRLAWDLIAFFALFIAPFVIPLYLPLPFAVAFWILAMLGEWVENRLRGQVDTTYAWMLGACFGLSWAVAKLVPGTLPGIGAGIACFCFLLWLQSLWKRLLGLKVQAGLKFDREASAPLCRETGPAPVTGASAWGGPAPVTPEGETLRVLSYGEFAMGGPVSCEYLFPDGSLILGAGASTGFSPDGRYFVAPLPSREGWGLLIYDRRDRLLYRCQEANNFWEIDRVDDTTVYGRNGPPDRSKAYAARIEDLIAHSSKEGMVAVRDLWIPEKDWDHIQRQRDRSFPAAPEGGPAITLVPHLPPSLMALEAPLHPIYYPKAELAVDGVASGFLISTNYPEAVWRGDGRALVSEAEAKDGDGEEAYRLWTAENGWRNLPKGRDLHDSTPPAHRDKLSGVDAACLTADWELFQPILTHDSFGQISGYGHSPLEIGRRSHPAPVFQQLLPLADDGRDDERLESASLKNGKRLVWRFLRKDEELSRQVYACALDGRPLDGEWLLDHRLSADGRFAAIVAYAPPPLIPHRVAILDADTGSLAWLSGDFCDPQLQGFGEDSLHFVHLVGRVHDGPDGTAHPAVDGQPPRADEAVPPLDEVRAFMRRRQGSCLHYRRTTATCRNGEWRTDSGMPSRPAPI
ncbi:hypothetical protein GXW71_10870 [Roseomonas hellenica]|uniref:Uncharacterized protein n=1 Tax=Plastoroseomonas hellenica TaxID=2687306 RepID=A0ABS5EX33_9PROT|nr:hypothetical protein [Plastoroseomonas hellenica]MBR0664854.1 hypothetical protein [Plastoroseomonas hellenica]